MSAIEETLRLEADDGFTFDGFVARAQGQTKGGVVIIQEIFGVTDQLKSVARRYAAEGFDAIVPAFFDRKSPATVIPFDTPDKGREIAMSLDPEEVVLDAAAAVEAVGGDGGVSVIGFCWGGGQALRLACRLDLTSAVAFYGTALEKHLAGCPGGPRCPMLFHFGDRDDHTPPQVIATVRDALPSAEIHLYEAGHAFANDARATFVEVAAGVANQRTLEFLNLRHGG